MLMKVVAGCRSFPSKIIKNKFHLFWVKPFSVSNYLSYEVESFGNEKKRASLETLDRFLNVLSDSRTVMCYETTKNFLKLKFFVSVKLPQGKH